MIAMTNANMRNLPTTPAPAPEKSWDKQDRAKAAAIKELGPQAIPGFDFDVYKCDGRWLWRAIAADKRPPVSDQQIKANGGKRAISTALATRAQINEAKAELSGEAAAHARVEAELEKKAGAIVTAAAVEKIMAAARKPVDTTEDANGVPAFLKRGGDKSVEAQEALVAKHKKTTGPDRVIKNPPDAKGPRSARRRPRARASGSSRGRRSSPARPTPRR